MKLSTQLKEAPLSQEAFPQTWKLLQSGINEEVAPGFVVGLWQNRHPDEIKTAAIGHRRLIPSLLPMTVETVFDLASVTKVFGTATLAASLVDRGWIQWHTPLKAFFPQYVSRQIELRHLLSHTAGLVAWEPYWEKMRAMCLPGKVHSVAIEQRQLWMRQWVLGNRPEYPPGERTLYSDLSFLLLGFALEEATQMPLDSAVKKLLWDPMGVQRAYFHRVHRPVNQDIHLEVAATEECPWRGGVLQGQVHDDNCWSMGGYGGHAGAFGTVRDILHFVRGLFGGFLSRETLHAAWTRVTEPSLCDRTLGWDTPSGDSPSASLKFSRRTVGHLGFTGTSLWIDLNAELAVAVLSNRVHPSRENTKIKGFRPLIHEAIRSDLERL